MIAIYNSNRPGFAGVLVDTETREVLADLIKLTDGWGIATQYKKQKGMRCKTERIAERFQGFDSEGYHDDETGEFVPSQKVGVSSKYKVCERFEFMDDLIDMVVSSIAPSAIITGGAGLGKSHSIIKALARADYKEERDYQMVKGFTTPLGLYRLLHDNRRELIIFDDCDSAFQDQTARNLLKGALDSTDRRIISWNSSKLPDGFEPTFEFSGRIIFISNIPINRFDPTLVSRSMIIDLQMTREEIIEHIEKIAPLVEISGLKPDSSQIADVVEFLQDNRDSISDLNIRTFIKVLKIRVHKRESNWQGMAEFMSCS